MTVTQRGQLDANDKAKLAAHLTIWSGAEESRERVRRVVVEMVEKSSYREVSRLTGFSTNTLQRWVREAKS